MRLGAVVIATILMVESGCSFAFVRGPSSPKSVGQGEPPQTPAEQPNNCTKSVLAPVLDTTAAAGFSLLAFIGWFFVACPGATSGDACFKYGSAANSSNVALAVASTAATLTLIASAIYGFSTTSRCRALPQPLPVATPPEPPASALLCLPQGDTPLRCALPTAPAAFR